MNPYTRPRPSSQNSTRGFTLIELLVAALVATTVIGVALGLIVEQRRNFLTDQTRSEANQNLRLGMEFIGIDIELAGERLESNSELPAISLIDGGSDPDQLVLQRKLLNTTLRVCEDFGVTDTAITVAYEANLPSSENCGVFSDLRSDSATEPDALTDSLNDFRDYRCSRDETETCERSSILSSTSDCDEECTLAYIHDPSADRGEFFLYTYEDCIDSDGGIEECDKQREPSEANGRILNRLHAIPLGPDGQINGHDASGDGDNQWQYDYDIGAEIYIIEERTYTLVSENPSDCNGDKSVLAVVQNRQDNCGPEPLAFNDSLNLEPMRLVNNLSEFDVTIETNSGSISGDFNYSGGVPTYDTSTDWREIEHIEIDLEALITDEIAGSDIIRADVNKNIDEEYNDGLDDSEKKRRLSTRFFPRNALSR